MRPHLKRLRSGMTLLGPETPKMDFVSELTDEGTQAVLGTWVGSGPPKVPSGVPGGPGISAAARGALVLGLVACPGAVWVRLVALFGPKMA